MFFMFFQQNQQKKQPRQMKYFCRDDPKHPFNPKALQHERRRSIIEISCPHLDLLIRYEKKDDAPVGEGSFAEVHKFQHLGDTPPPQDLPETLAVKTFRYNANPDHTTIPEHESKETAEIHGFSAFSPADHDQTTEDEKQPATKRMAMEFFEGKKFAEWIDAIINNPDLNPLERSVQFLTVQINIAKELEKLHLFIPIWRLLGKRAHNTPPIIPRIIIGLGLGALSFTTFAITTKLKVSHGINYPLISIAIGDLFLAAGELSIGPAIFSAVTDLAPKQSRSTFMGFWFLFLSFAAYLASILAKLSAAHTTNNSTQPFFHTFSLTAVLMLTACLLLAAVSPVLKKNLYLLHNPG